MYRDGEVLCIVTKPDNQLCHQRLNNAAWLDLSWKARRVASYHMEGIYHSLYPSLVHMKLTEWLTWVQAHVSCVLLEPTAKSLYVWCNVTLLLGLIGESVLFPIVIDPVLELVGCFYINNSVRKLVPYINYPLQKEVQPFLQLFYWRFWSICTKELVQD